MSEADYIAAQEISAVRGPAPRTEVGPPERRTYLLAGADGYESQRRRRTRRGTDARHHANSEDVIAYLRENQVTLTFDPAAGTLHAEGTAAIQIVTRKQVNPGPSGGPSLEGARKKGRRSPGAGGSPRPSDDPVCLKPENMGNYCVSEDCTKKPMLSDLRVFPD